jgi:hypothetical protein
MAKLAQDKREKTRNELEHVALVAAKWIKVGVLATRKSLNIDVVYPPQIEAALESLRKGCLDLGFTEENFWYAQKRAIHHVYGDPLIMAQSSGHKPHALPYWNPTRHRLNISPMGIIDHVDPKTREAKILDFVDSGAHVMIPECYTVGGKYSTLRGVAPQLQPLPRQIDNLLDLAPTTYAEWCSYQDSSLSRCCKTMTAWHDKGDCLVCTKCGKKIIGQVY